MDKAFNVKYPSVEDLRKKARKRMPRFAYEYLEGGCNEEINLAKNTSEIRDIELIPQYIGTYKGPDLSTSLFGHTWSAPFGIAPIGLQGLMWPGSPEILAQAAKKYNIPFILSTVSTASIEQIAEITEGTAWFQLYYPVDENTRNDVLRRVRKANFPVLVILCDVPSFGYRAKDIKNGLAMPPRMTIRNILQILSHPTWALKTLQKGRPKFKTLIPYIPKNLDMKRLGELMNENFLGKLDEDRIAVLRDQWKGKLVLKGVASEADAEKAVKLGIDGIIVSNHGGRQIDTGESSVKAMRRIAGNYGNKITVMMDSGIRSGPDVGRVLASGAQFTFLGRSFMYGVGALGQSGGDHVIEMLKAQLQQVMEQIGAEKVSDFVKFQAAKGIQ